ncbi:MAG: aldo/keto reductase [Candidatus Shapirobacteria bacterium]|jgi:hypothetical protein
MSNIFSSVYRLGFGAMRLPTVNGDPLKIDYPQGQEMISYALQNGINYFDTAYVYHGGESEKFLGSSLPKNTRSKYFIATKLPVSQVESIVDADRIFHEQLTRLQTDYIDFYLLHNLNSSAWTKVLSLDLISWAKKLKSQGLIKHLGFSMHDSYQVFETILNYHPWDFCQIQYNYLDVDYQAGQKGLKLAASKEIPVVVMEPLRGGLLAFSDCPPAISKVISQFPGSPCSLDIAFSWLYNQPEVSLVLSGMSTLNQLKQNIPLASKTLPGSLSTSFLDLVSQLKSAVNLPVPCTYCRYCSDCPQKINIPNVLNWINQAAYSGPTPFHQKMYSQIPPGQRPSDCLGCGLCERACPQKISIRKWLSESQKLFGL